ncbi:unnamed protein product [Rotaria sp. Silwood1]|nr:unnamed protein product [Rotaria sp. Silwood1]CAF1658257.1 unnamed protein product [Rotaria sp. Silwood1]
MLNKESNKIQKNLLNITTARYHSNHANFSLNAKLKYLPVDNSENLIEQPLCLVDELNLIRLPFESDHFHMSNDKRELIIVDKNEIPLSEPIIFKQLTLESIELEYIGDYRKSIQIIEISSHHSINKSITLNVKSISFDKLPASIKNRAKTIEEKFETLLINIQNKSHQLKQSERIRFEYFQFLYIRFNEEMEHEKNIEYLYDKIEKMQYDLHQKMTDSLEIIKLEDLNKLIKNVYDINQIEIPNYLKTKNEKLIHIFNFILRFLHNQLKIIEQYKNKIFNELEQFQIKSIDNNENFYFQQIIFIKNEITINNHKKLLRLIKKIESFIK